LWGRLSSLLYRQSSRGRLESLAEKDIDMSDAELVRELKAVGLLCGVSDREVVSWHGPVDNDLAQRVIAAHDKPAADSAVIALRDHLGATSDPWRTYVTVRNRRQRMTRRDLYLSVTDSLLFETLENAALTANGDAYEIRVPAAAWDNWKVEKQRIRTENPYSVEEGA
jgi:hypothetical protein